MQYLNLRSALIVTLIALAPVLGACPDNADSPPVRVVDEVDVSTDQDVASGADTAVDECADVLCEACDIKGAPFGGGTGTAGDPWLICTAAQLNEVGTKAQYMNGAFVLAQDVDLRNLREVAFVIIGGFGREFIGTFDGNGKEIRHLKIDEPTTDYVALFGYIGAKGSVKDLTLVDVNIIGREITGGLVGITYGTLDNVTVSGKVFSTNYGRAGGLAGHNLGTVRASRSTADMTSEQSEIGGLVGQNSGVVVDSSATGSVSGDSNVGGLVGSNEGTITDSFALGSVSGVFAVGGLVGDNGSNGVLSTSYASATTFATEGAVGGLVGRNSGQVLSSYASGSVAGGEGYSGGLVGFNSKTITQSYATVSVSGDFASNAGGLVGGDTMEGETFHSYWNMEASGVASSKGGEGLTNAQFADESSFDESWIFCPATDCLWVMPAGGPPRLKWVVTGN